MKKHICDECEDEEATLEYNGQEYCEECARGIITDDPEQFSAEFDRFIEDALENFNEIEEK